MKAITIFGGAAALAMMAMPALAQDMNKPGAGAMGTGAMAGDQMSNSMTTSTAPSTMSKSDMARMKKCQAMSADMMMKNKKCAAMMKMHPEMSSGSMAPMTN